MSGVSALRQSAPACSGPQADLRPAQNYLRNNSPTRQNDPDLSVLAGLRIDLDRTAMLLDDDIVADGEAKAGAFSGGLRREEGIENLFLHLRWNAGAIVAERISTRSPRLLVEAARVGT